MPNTMKDIYNIASQTEKTVIFGTGTIGKRLCSLLQDKGIQIYCFFNNNATENCIELGVPVKKPYKLTGHSVIYIIAVNDSNIRKMLYQQLIELGISEKNITVYYNYRTNEYLSTIPEEKYKDEISIMYYDFFGKEINWDAPKRYTEIINWEKINIHDPRRTMLADKYLVRNWIKEQIGEKYLTKLYGCWDDAEEIDFEVLPESFALKLNNGSGRNIIVKDKNSIDRIEICEHLNQWKKRNFAFDSLELQYRDIVPKILCEEYLEGVAEEVYDYNIYCFHGKPKYIWCIKGSHRPECKASFYDLNWKMQPFSYGYPRDEVEAPKPDKLEEMLVLSEKLCKDFKHVRVDWYNLPDGRVLFGEMTFSPWSGLNYWRPAEYDDFFGKLILENSES